MTSPETNLSRNFDGAPFFSSFSFFLVFLFSLSDVAANYHRTERVYTYSYYRTNYIIRIYVFYEEIWFAIWFSLCFRTSRDSVS